MATQFTTPASTVTALSTELDSLADGANKITTVAVTNSTGKDLFAHFILSLAAQGSARDTGAVVELYVIPVIGSDTAFGGDSLDPASEHYIGAFSFDAATDARVNIMPDKALPNTDFYLLVINRTGQAFAASGNTLKYKIYDGYEDV